MNTIIPSVSFSAKKRFEFAKLAQEQIEIMGRNSVANPPQTCCGQSGL